MLKNLQVLDRYLFSGYGFLWHIHGQSVINPYMKESSQLGLKLILSGPWQQSSLIPVFAQQLGFLNFTSGSVWKWRMCDVKFRKPNRTICCARHTYWLLLDTPLHGSKARGAKYAVYYAIVIMHTVFENIKWLHSCCVRITKAQSLPLLVYSLILFIISLAVDELNFTNILFSANQGHTQCEI